MNNWPINNRIMFVRRSDSKEECSVCLSGLQNRSVFKTSCRNMFHSRCLRACSNRSKKLVAIASETPNITNYYKLLNCPLCREHLWIPDNSITPQLPLPQLPLPHLQAPQSDPFEDYFDYLAYLLLEPVHEESMLLESTQAYGDSSSYDEPELRPAAQ